MIYSSISKILIFAFIFSFFGFNFVFADAVAPSAPHGFDAAGGPSGYELVLTWTNPQDEDLNQTEVYFGTSGGYYVSLFKTISATPNSKGQLTITDLSSSTDYFFSLKATDKSGNKSSPTAEIKRRTTSTVDSTSPDKVSSFAATDTKAGGEITLSWTNPADDDFFQAIIYKSAQDDFTISDGVRFAIRTKHLC